MTDEFVKSRGLGIQFGGLKAVDEFNLKWIKTNYMV